jgi:hypothetical protein
MKSVSKKAGAVQIETTISGWQSKNFNPRAGVGASLTPQHPYQG